MLDANLPVLDSVSAALMSQEEHKILRELVEAAVEKSEKQRWKFIGDRWEERVLARLRVGVLATNAWRVKLGLSNNVKCRHCLTNEETIEHWLFDHCANLGSNFRLEEDFGVTTVEEVREVLKTEADPRREAMQRRLIVRTRLSDLFRYV